MAWGSRKVQPEQEQEEKTAVDREKVAAINSSSAALRTETERAEKNRF